MGLNKPKGRLDHLPDDQFDQLVKWLLGGMSYRKVLLLLEKPPFYLETSERALSEFWDEYCSQALLERRQRAARLAMGVRKEMEANPADFDTATIELLSRWAFEMASASTLDPDEVKKIMVLLLKRRDQDLKSKQVDASLRRIELMEKREAQAKETLASGKLTDAERKAKLKEIFGI